MIDHPLLASWALPVEVPPSSRPALPSDGAGWRELLAAVLAHRLEVLFLHNLRVAGRLDAVPSSALDVLEKRAAALRMQNLHLAGAARALARNLDERGVDHLFLKGVVLRSTAYARIGGRPMGDVDLLVRRADRRRAQDALQELGFAPDADGHATWWHAQAASHSLGELTYSKPTPAQRVKVDLHWALTKGARGEVFMEDGLWSEVDCFDLAGHRARTLAGPWFAVHLAVHLTKDLVISRPALLGYADLLLAVRTGGDWDEVRALAARQGVAEEIEFVGRRLSALDPSTFGAPTGTATTSTELLERDLLRVRDDDHFDARRLRSAYYRALILDVPDLSDRLRYGAGLLLPRPRQLARMHRGSTTVGSTAGYAHHLRQAVSTVISWRSPAGRSQARPSETEDELQLVRAALMPEDEAVKIWSAWVCGRDLGNLPDHQYPILPVIYRRLRSCLGDDEHGALLRGQYRHTWARQQLLRRELEAVEDVLRRAGIGFRRYGWSGARSPGDVSTLGDEALAVGRRQLPRVTELVLEEGWRHAPRRRVPPILLPLAQRFDRRATRHFAKDPGLRLRVVGAPVDIAAEDIGGEQGRDAVRRLSETLAAAAGHPASKLGWLVEIGRQVADLPVGADLARLDEQLVERSREGGGTGLLQALHEVLGPEWLPSGAVASRILVESATGGSGRR